MIAALADCPHTQRIRFAKQHDVDGAYVYDMYSDYATHGDLSNLVHRYSNSSTQIPESFIWHVFAALADAIHTMKTGHCASKASSRQRKKHRQSRTAKPSVTQARQPLPTTQHIVHLDIKPANVFLHAPNQSSYSHPVLADFGITQYQGPELDVHAARLQGDLGTEGYMAPEITNEKLHHHAVTSAADVWSTGMVMCRMMNA